MNEISEAVCLECSTRTKEASLPSRESRPSPAVGSGLTNCDRVRAYLRGRGPTRQGVIAAALGMTPNLVGVVLNQYRGAVFEHLPAERAWTLADGEEAVTVQMGRPPHRQRIAEAIQAHGPLTVRDIASVTKLVPKQVDHTLRKLEGKTFVQDNNHKWRTCDRD